MVQNLTELLFNALNEQGHLFQERCWDVLRSAQETTRWAVKAYDYPVSLNGLETKIDLVLQYQGNPHPEIYALIECKRADPEYVYWLFGAPYARRRGAGFIATLKCSEVRSDRPSTFVSKVEEAQLIRPSLLAHNWMEVKRNSKGRASTVQNIEDAFVQVLKGAGGFGQEQLAQRRKSPKTFETYFIPIVITTAKLYVATYDISNVDLLTGKIDRSNVRFADDEDAVEEVDWVLVDYDAGQTLASQAIPEDYAGVDPFQLQQYKLKSILVVNSGKILTFFRQLPTSA